MKTLSTQIIYFLRQRPSRMNIANLLEIVSIYTWLGNQGCFSRIAFNCDSSSAFRIAGCAFPPAARIT